MNKKIVFFLVLFTLILFSFVSASPDEINYIPGHILVGFEDDVTVEEVNILVNSFDLDWESHFPDKFSFWVKVLNGSPEDFIEDLEASEIVLWAEHRGNPQDSSSEYILVQFNIFATEQTAMQLINSFDNLEFSSINSAPKWGIVQVPIGEEQKWIEVFQNKEGVTYAELSEVALVTKTNPDKEKPETPNEFYYLIAIGSVVFIIIIFLVLKKK